MERELDLNLVESFLSIQGEGASIGRLAIFLRFAGCNLTCKGFGVQTISQKTGEILTGCDTIRAVFTKHFEYKSIKFANELSEIITQKSQNLYQKPIIIITGGEPLLHYKNEILLEFLKWAYLQKYEIHFETNGTIEIDFDKFEIYKNCHFAIGVKLENSGESKAKRINKSALCAIKQNAKSSFYKFVLDKASCENSTAIKQIRQILDICENEIYCMAQGHDKKSLEQNAKSVAEFAIRHGFCYCDRIHIRLWNDKEGI